MDDLLQRLDAISARVGNSENTGVQLSIDRRANVLLEHSVAYWLGLPDGEFVNPTGFATIDEALADADVQLTSRGF